MIFSGVHFWVWNEDVLFYVDFITQETELLGFPVKPFFQTDIPDIYSIAPWPIFTAKTGWQIHQSLSSRNQI